MKLIREAPGCTQGFCEADGNDALGVIAVVPQVETHVQVRVHIRDIQCGQVCTDIHTIVADAAIRSHSHEGRLVGIPRG